ncbi:hypothetical protein X975_14240, partial [Stegodyphus mimosarum]
MVKFQKIQYWIHYSTQHYFNEFIFIFSVILHHMWSDVTSINKCLHWLVHLFAKQITSKVILERSTRDIYGNIDNPSLNSLWDVSNH